MSDGEIDIPLASILQKLSQLENGLEEGIAEPSPRAAAIKALDAVIEFIQSIDRLKDRSLFATLFKLQFSLNDLDKGVVSPELKPVLFPNRHPAPTSRQLIHGYCIFYVSSLMDNGIGLRQACAEVAKALIDAGYDLENRPSTPPWKTLKAWRDDLSRKPKDHQTRHLVESLQSTGWFDGFSLGEIQISIEVGVRKLVSEVG